MLQVKAFINSMRAESKGGNRIIIYDIYNNLYYNI